MDEPDEGQERDADGPTGTDAGDLPDGSGDGDGDGEDTPSGADEATDVDTDPSSDTGADTDFSSDTGAGTGSSSDSDSDDGPGTDAGAGSGSGSDTDAGSDTSMTGDDGDSVADVESGSGGGDDADVESDEDGRAVGHGAHPGERHEPTTDIGVSTSAGHAGGAPVPEESSEDGADAETDSESLSEEFEQTAPDPASADGGGLEGGAEATTAGTDAGRRSPVETERPSPPELESATGAESDGDPDEPELGGDAPPDDEEMPLSAHIEEMIRRLAVVVIAAALATAFAFPGATRLLNAMWYGVLPTDIPPPTLYGPLEKILSEIKVASLAGILVALPVIVYETYLFMRPGLYPKERRYFLAAVPTSLVLGSIGMAFAYFLVLPFLFQYFITYSESAVDALPFGLRVTFDLIVSLLGAFALVFQIPLLIMLAVMIGVVSRRWLEEQRLLFHGLFLGIGFFISLGDATGTAPLIIAATMGVLFEGTLALLRWTGRN